MEAEAMSRNHCKQLEAKGIRPEIAREMACWDPADEARKAVPGVIWAAIIALVAGLALISSIVIAKESESQIEAAMVACLNGKPFRAGIEFFKCERLGVL